MLDSQTPRWLRYLERKLQWLAIPNIGVLFVTLQALGFLMVMADPIWIARLALVPELVLSRGEYWRLVTFLALPLSTSPIFVLLVLWFLYFILNTIENEWGAFKTTLYVLVSVVLTLVYSMTTGYPVTQISHFQSTLFLAAATLFPEQEVQLFLFVPVKMRWLAWLTLAFIVLELIRDDWPGRFFLIVIYSNYLLFFGPAMMSGLRQSIRRRKFKREWKR